MSVVLGKKQFLILKANGNSEAFDAGKLEASLLRAGATEEAIDTITEHVSEELYDGITTTEIYSHAFKLLKESKKPVAHRYSLRRALMDLGPSGFPFEDFVAELLRSTGLTAVTRQIVLGGCIPHEVDVVAWNEKKLLMIEAKFHNELGIKSDVKVALYMKARFDDLKENVFNYGGKDRKVTECWLITNTKFSSTAIHYGICKNLTMIGWNYPEKGNLQDLIEENKLFPITALTTLSEANKKLILKSGSVMCSSFLKDPSLFQKILGTSFNYGPVINEINEL
jgi:hypothetical protein